jgi:hypothetical protein
MKNISPTFCGGGLSFSRRYYCIGWTLLSTRSLQLAADDAAFLFREAICVFGAEML